MNKWRLCILLWVVPLLAATVFVSGPAHAGESRAFWVDAWHSGFENPTATTNMVNYITACNANVVVMEVRKRADAYYTSSYEPTGWNITPDPGYDCLADVVTKAHAQGLEVHTWVVVYRVWTFTTPPPETTPTHVFTAHPEWFSYTDSGEMFDSANCSWLDPGHPEVEDYHTNVFMEIIEDYDIDGFHLDYIRYPGTHWGYNPVAVQRYNDEYGTSGNPRWNKSTWMNWRRDQVSNMVKRMYLEAKAAKPYIKMGASVWSTAGTGNSTYYQNWDLWMQKHWLDYCSPMNYTGSNGTFEANCDDSFGRQYGHHIYMGQGSYVNTIENSMIQIQYVQSKPFPGVCLYSYYATNSGTIDREGFKNALLAGPFASSASVPSMSWISSPSKGMLKGFVKNQAGEPVYPATVTVQGPGVSTKDTGTGFYGFVDLDPNTYTVTASASGYEDTSGSAQITAGAVTHLDLTFGGGDTEPPTVPQNLVATPISSTQIDLTWDPSTDNVGVVGYKIYRDSVQIDTSPTNSYSDTSCSPSTTYTYEVSAYDAAENESGKSDPAVATTPGDTTPPVISNVQSVPAPGKVTITWDTDEPATSQVEYGLTTSYGNLTPLDPDLVTSHSVLIEGLARKTTYHYRVTSKDAAENEAISGDYTFKTK